MSLTVPLKKGLGLIWTKTFWKNWIRREIWLALVLKLILVFAIKLIMTRYQIQNQTQRILKGKQPIYTAQTQESALLLQRHSLTLELTESALGVPLYIATPQKLKTQTLSGYIVSGTVGNTLKYD